MPTTRPTIRTARLLATAALAAGAAVIAVAAPAGACGGLVGENGTIQLTKTTTLAAYHDGVERYVTSFQFTGEGEEVGSIIPLPDVPTDVVRGGDWTLQRLAQEVAPAERAFAFTADAANESAAGAEVLLETKIDALDITVLKGGGDDVGRWARDNGFLLTPDAPEMLDFYGRRSEIFMAARFDASRARALGQTAGDGTPIMLTIPTDQPWVPLRILSLGLEGSEFVEADVFLLTDERPSLLAGGPGLDLARSEAASEPLLSDLRSDVGMEWVPDEMWFTYLQVGTEARALDYDLAISADPTTPPTITDTGVEVSEAQPVLAAGGALPLWPLALGGLVGLIVAALYLGRDRRPDSPVPA
ncbi:MAG: DUF2330 domain-containing protein [Acidimicrobiales bacterium]